MFSQLYTINKMQESVNPVRPSQKKADDKNEYLEQVPTQTSRGELEKGNGVAKVTSRTPTVHHKVMSDPQVQILFELKVNVDVMASLLIFDMHVISVGRLADTTLSIRLGSTYHISRHRRCGSLCLVRHWISYPECRTLSLRRCSLGYVGTAEGDVYSCV